MNPIPQSYEKITLAFYKGGDRLIHKIIRWWTKSKYSHVELILPDNITWITISPFVNSKVTNRIKINKPSSKDWDYIELPFSHRPAVREWQVLQLYKFLEDTQFSKYDWTGMILSQIGPFIIKNKNKWYCSEWIAYALLHSRILTWDKIRIYSTPDISPARLHQLVYNYIPDHYS